MRPNCKSCKHFMEWQSFIPRCNHPDARQFDRVYGYISAPIGSIDGEKADKVLQDCDREGRFEQVKKPWWMPS